MGVNSVCNNISAQCEQLTSSLRHVAKNGSECKYTTMTTCLRTCKQTAAVIPRHVASCIVCKLIKGACPPSADSCCTSYALLRRDAEPQARRNRPLAGVSESHALIPITSMQALVPRHRAPSKGHALVIPKCTCACPGDVCGRGMDC